MSPAVALLLKELAVDVILELAERRTAGEEAIVIHEANVSSDSPEDALAEVIKDPDAKVSLVTALTDVLEWAMSFGGK